MKWIALSALVAILVSGATWFILGRGLNVNVTNESANTLTNVQLIYTGRSVSILQLKPGEKQRVCIYPKGESSLTVTFSEVPGSLRKLEVDTYFELCNSGDINVTITPELKLKHTEKLNNY